MFSACFESQAGRFGTYAKPVGWSRSTSRTNKRTSAYVYQRVCARTRASTRARTHAHPHAHMARTHAHTHALARAHTHAWAHFVRPDRAVLGVHLKDSRALPVIGSKCKRVHAQSFARRSCKRRRACGEALKDLHAKPFHPPAQRRVIRVPQCCSTPAY